MRHKYEVLAKFKEWKAEVETQTGRKGKYLLFKNRGEYKFKEFEQFCKAKDVARQFTTPNPPQQNSAAKG